MTFDDFRSHVADARSADTERLVVPVSARRSADLLTPVSAFLSVRADSDYGFLFESVEGG